MGQSRQHWLPWLIAQHEAGRRSLVSGPSLELILFYHLLSDSSAVQAKAVPSVRYTYDAPATLATSSRLANRARQVLDTLRASRLPPERCAWLILQGFRNQSPDGILRSSAAAPVPLHPAVHMQPCCAACQRLFARAYCRDLPQSGIGRGPPPGLSLPSAHRHTNTPFDLRPPQDCCRLHMANTLPKVDG